MPPLERNERLVLDLLAGEPNGLTRSELRERARLSKPTIGGIVEELREAGLITEAKPAGNGNGTPPAGRRAERWVLARRAGYVMALDVGHGHLRAAVADRGGHVQGEIAQNTSIDVDRIGTSALGAAMDLLEQALGSAGAGEQDVHAIGVGIPAPIDDAGHVLFTDYLPTWSTFDIAEELDVFLKARFPAMRLARSNIRVENDANLGALGEGLHGAAVGRRDYLYVKLSTGVGMGVVLDNWIHRGLNGAGGELGHVTVSPTAEALIKSEIRRPTSTCPRCGKIDCLENLASCRAIVRQLQATHPDYKPSLQISEVIRAAREDRVHHPLCRQAIVDAGIRIGYTLTDILRIYAPESVVIGGLLAEAGDMLLEPITEAIDGAKGIQPAEVVAVSPERIVRSEVEGAVALALDATSFTTARALPSAS